MIMLAVLFWFIIFWFVYKFVFGFVIPAVAAGKNIKSKIKDMSENINQFDESRHAAEQPQKNYRPNTSNSSSYKDDYIDFEEIK